MRGLWLKIWMDSHPRSDPRSTAFSRPPAVETCAPTNIGPSYGAGRKSLGRLALHPAGALFMAQVEVDPVIAPAQIFIHEEVLREREESRAPADVEAVGEAAEGDAFDFFVGKEVDASVFAVVRVPLGGPAEAQVDAVPGSADVGAGDVTAVGQG